MRILKYAISTGALTAWRWRNTNHFINYISPTSLKTSAELATMSFFPAHDGPDIFSVSDRRLRGHISRPSYFSWTSFRKISRSTWTHPAVRFMQDSIYDTMHTSILSTQLYGDGSSMGAILLCAVQGNAQLYRIRSWSISHVIKPPISNPSREIPETQKELYEIIPTFGQPYKKILECDRILDDSWGSQILWHDDEILLRVRLLNFNRHEKNRGRVVLWAWEKGYQHRCRIECSYLWFCVVQAQQIMEEEFQQRGKKMLLTL